MKGTILFAVLIALVAMPFAITTQVNSRVFWDTSISCNGGNASWMLANVLRVAPTPGDVACGTGDIFYYCVDGVKLNVSTPGNNFGGATDVTPGTGYYNYVYVDFIGKTLVNGYTLDGQQDRNAAKSTWRPRVFVKRVGGTCYNWNYLNFNDLNNLSGIIGYSPADNNASGQIGGFYLINDTYGSGGQTAGSVVGGGAGDLPSGEVGSDAQIVYKEAGSSGYDSVAIRVYNQGYAGSWPFKEGDSRIDMFFYNAPGTNYFQVIRAPLTTARGTVFGTNPSMSKVSFEVTPVVSKPKKK